MRWLLVRSCISPCSCSLGIPAPLSACAAALRSSTDSPDSLAPSKRGTSHRIMSLQEQRRSTLGETGIVLPHQVLSRSFISTRTGSAKHSCNTCP